MTPEVGPDQELVLVGSTRKRISCVACARSQAGHRCGLPEARRTVRRDPGSVQSAMPAPTHRATPLLGIDPCLLLLLPLAGAHTTLQCRPLKTPSLPGRRRGRRRRWRTFPCVSFCSSFSSYSEGRIPPSLQCLARASDAETRRRDAENRAKDAKTRAMDAETRKPDAEIRAMPGPPERRVPLGGAAGLPWGRRADEPARGRRCGPGRKSVGSSAK